MLAGLNASNATFLSDISATENRLSQVNRELSSGLRVNQASDDPGAISAILGFQSQIDQVTQTQGNLSQATTSAQVADASLSSTSNLLDRLTSIAAQGANSSQTSDSRNVLGQQVQAIEQQLVSLANTNFGGRYVFGGDDPTTQPYTFNWSVPGGVVRNNTAGSTITLQNTDGDTIIPGQTAQQIFDSQNPDGSVAAGNIFQNVYALGQALQNNDPTAVATAAQALKSSVVTLGQATTVSGNTLSWLQDSTDAASAKLTHLQGQLSGLRDADVAQAATQLTLEQTSLQAALAAHGSLNLKNLFSYLG